MAEQVGDILSQPVFPEQVPNLTPKNPPKIVFLVVFVLMLSGAVFAGIQIGQKQKPKTPGEILFNQPTAILTPKPSCGPCLVYSPPPPGWCDEGKVVGRENDECGCPQPPICQMPTNTWKAYRNSVYGFEFRYPEKWAISVPSLEGKHEDNKSVLRVDLVSDKDFKNELLLEKRLDILSISFIVWEKGDKDFKSAFGEWSKFQQNKFAVNLSQENINGISWVKKEIVGADDVRILLYISEKGSFLYLIEVTPFESYKIGVFDQILSTFKFIE